MTNPDPREHALAALRAGVSVIPIDHSSKRPPAGFSWKHLQSTRATPDEVTRWFVHDLREAFAGICGAVSGNLLVIDFDEPEYFPAWLNATKGIRDGVVTQETQGGGYQAWFRSAEPVPGNEKLAWHPAENEVGRVIAIETRGEGGYAVMAPSLGPTGKRYVLLDGGWTSIPTLPAAQVDALLLSARKLCRAPFTRQQLELAKASQKPAARRSDASGGGGSVIDAFNQKNALRDVLARFGYTPAFQGRYNRPGGETASVLISQDGCRSFHFSSNDPLNDGKQQDAFNVFAKLGHNGNVTEAVKAAARELGMDKPAPAHTERRQIVKVADVSDQDRHAKLRKVVEETAAGQRKTLPWSHSLLTKLTKALIPGTSTAVCGPPGSSKSWFVLSEMIFWWGNGYRPAAKMLEETHDWHMRRALALIAGDDSLSPGGDAKGEAYLKAFAEHEQALRDFGKCVDDASDDETYNDLLRWAEAKAKEGHQIILIDPVTMADGETGTVHIDDKAFVRGLGKIEQRTGARIVTVNHPKGGKPSENPLDDMAGGRSWQRFLQSILILQSHKRKPRYASVRDRFGMGERSIVVPRSALIAKARNGKGEGMTIALDQDERTLKFSELGVIVRDCKESDVRTPCAPPADVVEDPFA